MPVQFLAPTFDTFRHGVMLNAMTVKKSKLKIEKKKLTLDDFAAAIQKDYAAIRRDMATKEDIRQIREGMATGFRNVRDEMATRMAMRDLQADVKTITDVMVSKADLAEAVRTELDAPSQARAIDDLRTRVLHVEEKLGIKRNRRAA